MTSRSTTGLEALVRTKKRTVEGFAKERGKATKAARTVHDDNQGYCSSTMTIEVDS